MNSRIFYIIVFMNLLQTTMIFGIKPVVALFASSLGVTTFQISLIVAAYALIPAFFAVQIGKWTDKYGVKAISVLGNSLMLLALLLSSLFPTFWMILVQQTILGIAITFSMLSQQKCVGSLGGDIDRSIANYSLFSSLGAMIGPLLSSPLYEHFGYRVCIYLNTLFIALALISGFFLKKGLGKEPGTGKRAPAADEGERASIWVLMRNRDLRNAVIISGLVISNRELFASYFPLLAEKMGISPTMIGIMLAFSGFIMLVVRFGQTALVRAFGRMNVLTYSLYISGLIYLLTPFSSWIIILFVLVGILGGGLGLGQPLSISSVLENSPPNRAGEVLGFRITINRVSQFAIPLVFGGIGGIAGVAAVFWASGLVLTFFGYLTRPLNNAALSEAKTER